MTTHKTLEAARQFAAADESVVSIIQIEHATEGLVYICAKCSLAQLESALRRKPMAEIVRVVAACDVDADEVDDCRCERCGCQVDRSTAYTQQEPHLLGGRRVLVNAYYCVACRNVLAAVGAGEHSALAARRADATAVEPSYKSDVQ